MTNLKVKILALCLICVSIVNAFSQETPPAPGAPKSVTVPAVQEIKLRNGLTVSVVERKSVPLVTIELLVRSGASSEDPSKAGLANLTAAMLTKGTKTRTATQIAERIEFLGGSINSGAGWNNSFVSVTVTSDKVDQAMAILADVVLNPAFDQKELDLLKTQTIDELTANLKQPGFLASYVASKYSFGEHPAGGTPASINSITREDITKFYSANFSSDQSVIIFTGDVSLGRARSLTTEFFGKWKKFDGLGGSGAGEAGTSGSNLLLRRMLVVDLSKSGQASVGYYIRTGAGRGSAVYYPASVLNSVLGAGYSSRLNFEIRIKRGLSYDAGSGFAWRWSAANLSARAQTKNESAAEVAELVLAELRKLTETLVNSQELTPRKSALTGNFGRNLETTAGLARALAELYTFGIPPSELNAYVAKINGVTNQQIRDLASLDLFGGDLIIVGDYSIFKNDLAKRFPPAQIEVIKADELDLSKDNLRK